MALVFKICPQPLWRAALTAGRFDGSADDRRDGFIHLSAADQVEGTLARHFAGAADLLILAVEADRLGASLRWEPSRGGALFPHLHAALPTAAVLWARPVTIGPAGRHVLPELA